LCTNFDKILIHTLQHFCKANAKIKSFYNFQYIKAPFDKKNHLTPKSIKIFNFSPNFIIEIVLITFYQGRRLNRNSTLNLEF
jgi:hypothetical protein